MTHGSLFSGIGGAELAAEKMGWKNVFHCEINPFGRKVLDYYWPNAKSYDNIKTTDFSIWRGRIDILTGGFPCQPFSSAGKRKGTEDDRHLWPEMLRAIREIEPRWVVGENVHGLVNWNDGMVFEQVQTDLENEGYEVQPYILPAVSVNAPHRRDRVWFVAYSGLQRQKERQQHTMGAFELCEKRTTSDAGDKGLQGRKDIRVAESSREKRKKQSSGCILPDWEKFPNQSPICGRNDGLPTELDGVTFPKWRNESIKGYGNAWVPHVAYQIFKAIEEYEKI